MTAPMIRADAPELAALVGALQESQAQIAYLHERLGEGTGSGNAVMARNTAALAAWEAIAPKPATDALKGDTHE